MLTSETFPAAADVERFGNLLLSAWSPPSHRVLVDGWMESAIDAVLRCASDVFLLGYKPALARSLPVPQDMLALFVYLTKETERGPHYRIPVDIARASTALLRPGDLHVRQRRTDGSTGVTHVESTYLGRVLALMSVADALRALQGVTVAAPLQVNLSCLTNPQAGLRQPDARWLRSMRDWTGNVVGITWLGDSLTLLGGREALLQLRVGLLAWQEQPQSGV